MCKGGEKRNLVRGASSHQRGSCVPLVSLLTAAMPRLCSWYKAYVAPSVTTDKSHYVPHHNPLCDASLYIFTNFTFYIYIIIIHLRYLTKPSFNVVPKQYIIVAFPCQNAILFILFSIHLLILAIDKFIYIWPSPPLRGSWVASDMGRAPCCEKVGLKKGRWTAEEDEILTKYIQANGEGSWRSLPKNAGI